MGLYRYGEFCDCYTYLEKDFAELENECIFAPYKPTRKKNIVTSI